MSQASLSLEGRTAVVTGAARGLGHAHALALASRGARVVALDVIDGSDVVAAIEGIGGHAESLIVDLADARAADDAIARVLDSHGDVHVLVNNAGAVRDRMSFNLSTADWEHVLAVNLSATFHLSAAMARAWRECSGTDHRRRSIVNTSSESGLYGNPGQANYAAAKAGVAALTLTMAAELHRYGVRINAIVPRARTPMSEQAFGVLPRDGSVDRFAPEHVAQVVAWLASDAAADVSGRVLLVHGASVALMRTWSVEREVPRQGALSDDELLGLRDRLFPDGAGQRLASPIGQLFVGATHARGESSDG